MGRSVSEAKQDANVRWTVFVPDTAETLCHVGVWCAVGFGSGICNQGCRKMFCSLSGCGCGGAVVQGDWRQVGSAVGIVSGWDWQAALSKCFFCGSPGCFSYNQSQLVCLRVCVCECVSRWDASALQIFKQTHTDVLILTDGCCFFTFLRVCLLRVGAKPLPCHSSKLTLMRKVPELQWCVFYFYF